VISQADAILAHLRAGNTITPAEAYSLFGCLALHSRIAELRERGHVIACRIVQAGRKHFGEYRIAA